MGFLDASSLKGAGIGGLAMGPMGILPGAVIGNGGLGKDNSPTMQQQQLDPATVAMQNKVLSESSQTPEEILAKNTEGVKDIGENAMKELPERENRSSTSLGMNPALNEAIENKAKHNFESGMNDMNRQLTQQATLKKQQMLQSSAQMLLGNAQQQQQQNQMAVDAFNVKQKIRSNLIGNLFGGAGAIGGIAAGGGFSSKNNNTAAPLSQMQAQNDQNTYMGAFNG